jgi:hypothetical protein
VEIVEAADNSTDLLIDPLRLYFMGATRWTHDLPEAFGITRTLEPADRRSSRYPWENEERCATLSLPKDSD